MKLLELNKFASQNKSIYFNFVRCCSGPLRCTNFCTYRPCTVHLLRSLWHRLIYFMREISVIIKVNLFIIITFCSSFLKGLLSRCLFRLAKFSSVFRLAKFSSVWLQKLYTLCSRLCTEPFEGVGGRSRKSGMREEEGHEASTTKVVLRLV